MKLSAELKSFAQSRERHYRSYRQLDLSRAEAISQVLRFASRIEKVPQDKALRMLPQVSDHLWTLLPSEDSRFVGLRKKILSLLEAAS